MPGFPTRIADVTQAWICEILDIDSAAIKAFSIDVPGENPGFGSEIAFVRLDAGPDIPASLMIKVPPEYPDAADLVQAYGSFLREAAFYKHLAAQTPVRTPRAYAIEASDDGRDAIMVLEDCSRMTQLPFLDGPPSLTQLMAVVRSAARLHAHWWGRATELAAFDIIMRPGQGQWDEFGQTTTGPSGTMQQWLASPWVEYAPSDAVPALQTLSKYFDKLITDGWPDRNLTLCHMDFHQQNMFIDEDAPDDPIVIFDWDGCHIGSGAHDVAYLLSFLPVEYRRDIESAILLTYHNELLASGVSAYTLQDLRDDYRFGCVFNTYLLPMCLSLDFSGEDSQQLATQVIEGFLCNMLDHDGPALVAQLSATLT
jgi:aminoglycoside phosphotransferase (APT) family kinase protein